MKMPSRRLLLVALLAGAALCWSSIVVIGSDRVASQGRDEEASVEITPATASPGIAVRVTGQCHRSGWQADYIALSVYRVGGAGGGYYGLVEVVPRIDRGQRVTHDFVVPDDAVNGQYHATITCFLQDQLFAWAQTPFEVTGGRDPETVTTTGPTTTTSAVTTTEPTTTSSPTTSTTSGPGPVPEGGAPVLDPPSPPASPVPGRVAYTG